MGCLMMATKDIELSGSQAFIEANFHMIRDLLAENSQKLQKKHGLKKKPIKVIKDISVSINLS